MFDQLSFFVFDAMESVDVFFVPRHAALVLAYVIPLTVLLPTSVLGHFLTFHVD